MTPITDDDWQRMSWHQRQRYLTAQTRHLRALREQLDHATHAPCPDCADHAERHRAAQVGHITNEARRILANLDPDPEADRHRAELEAAISTRAKERAA